MRHKQRLIAVTAFASAAGLCFAGALWAVTTIENRSATAVTEALHTAGYEWVDVATDGLQVTLSGEAATEAMRFRALTIGGEVVDSARLIDHMTVAAAAVIEAPQFQLEILRNDDGVQLIGLVPAADGDAGIADTITGLAPEARVIDMLESADYPVPDGWEGALSFGIEALRMLPRSKISVTADRVAVTALSDSATEKRRIETELTRMAPAGLHLALAISAPRPVIAPFTLRFVVDDEGARFDACSADSDRARARIINAGAAAGVEGAVTCTVGLGVPSPAWAEAVSLGIAAAAELGHATISFSDTDVSLIAGEDVAQARFDHVVGELQTALPDVFSLQAVLPEKPEAPRTLEGPVEFTATLGEDGRVQLRGRLGDERMRAAVDSYARARFGGEAVHTATRFDPDLPDGWPIRVLSALEALGELHTGQATVRPDLVEIRGTTGNREARGTISRILSDKLGQGKDYRISVTYDESLDPVAGLPSPQECVAQINAHLREQKISFSPGSANMDPAARRVLDNIADVIRDCMDVPMEIGGHTDSQGREEMNLRLSQQRAQAVVEALRARRVPVSQLTARGYGPAEPVADNGTEAGREANRRIEFKLIGAEESAPDLDESEIEVVAEQAGEGTPRPRHRPESDD
ncbi:OmpA family protein [Plastorhodobacter daqingensis]|uniref:OmpA family protein n=1 Tax=Plastorhodobacter daqingensis TaxID=1387281 RepID=A0ABW2UNX5_9RHOB